MSDKGIMEIIVDWTAKLEEHGTRRDSFSIVMLTTLAVREVGIRDTDGVMPWGIEQGYFQVDGDRFGVTARGVAVAVAYAERMAQEARESDE